MKEKISFTFKIARFDEFQVVAGEENHLGYTGQVRMEVNAVTAPVIYAAVNQAPKRTAQVIGDCENTLNALGNCHACNKPRHAKRLPVANPSPDEL